MSGMSHFKKFQIVCLNCGSESISIKAKIKKGDTHAHIVCQNCGNRETETAVTPIIEGESDAMSKM